MMRFLAKPSLRETRKQLYSQRRMAELISTATGEQKTRSFYAHIERGVRATDSEIAVTISEILKCRVDTLFFPSDESNKGWSQGKERAV